ncbi:unnamed protein product, partial [Cuscuta campestris]
METMMRWPTLTYEKELQMALLPIHQSIIIQTDQKSSIWLLEGKATMPCLQFWLSNLMSYIYGVHYKQGHEEGQDQLRRSSSLLDDIKQSWFLGPKLQEYNQQLQPSQISTKVWNWREVFRGFIVGLPKSQVIPITILNFELFGRNPKQMHVKRIWDPGISALPKFCPKRVQWKQLRQTEWINKHLETYLRGMCFHNPKPCLSGETNVKIVDRSLQQGEDIAMFNQLKWQLQRAQSQMQLLASHLSPVKDGACLLGLFHVISKEGKVVYKLHLPPKFKTHSQPKANKKISEKSKHRRGAVLVSWQEILVEETTWEWSVDSMKKVPTSSFEDKALAKGEGMMRALLNYCWNSIDMSLGTLFFLEEFPRLY